MDETELPGVVECLSKLSRAGFDASAFDTARWVGVAVLAVAGLVLLAHTAKHLLVSKSEFPVESRVFFFLGGLGFLLIALPIVTKVVYAENSVDLGSSDRQFAQAFCRDRALAPAAEAETAAVRQELEALTERYEWLSAAVAEDRNTPPPTMASERPMLGMAVAIYPRSSRIADAEGIARALRSEGAGVTVTETDLSESAAAPTSGANVILFSEASRERASRLQAFLESQGVAVAALRGPLALRGESLQLLLY